MTRDKAYHLSRGQTRILWNLTEGPMPRSRSQNWTRLISRGLVVPLDVDADRWTITGAGVECLNRQTILGYAIGFEKVEEEGRNNQPWRAMAYIVRRSGNVGDYALSPGVGANPEEARAHLIAWSKKVRGIVAAQFVDTTQGRHRMQTLLTPERFAKHDKRIAELATTYVVYDDQQREIRSMSDDRTLRIFRNKLPKASFKVVFDGDHTTYREGDSERPITTLKEAEYLAEILLTRQRQDYGIAEIVNIKTGGTVYYVQSGRYSTRMPSRAGAEAWLARHVCWAPQAQAI